MKTRRITIEQIDAAVDALRIGLKAVERIATPLGSVTWHIYEARKDEIRFAINTLLRLKGETK